MTPQEWSSTDPSLVYPSTTTTECYDEQLSDKCLTLLLGTWYEHTLSLFQANSDHFNLNHRFPPAPSYPSVITMLSDKSSESKL